jgi:Mrp family chromosome partitioning ATPase
MVNLTAEMAQLWASLGPPVQGHGRVVQFVAATKGEGASTIAREFARFAAGRSARPVWLVDLDLMGPGQHGAIAAEPERYGLLGRPAAASPGGEAFFTVQPAMRTARGRTVADAQYLCAQPAGGSRLWVTRFRREMLRPGQSAQLVASGEYWTALRRHAEIVAVDAPSADRSAAALVTAPFVDLTVLVVAADGKDTRAPAALRDAIEQAGGRCAGIVFNRAAIAPPKFLKAILG